MALRHEGVSPSKFWYTWQKTKGILKTFPDKNYGKDAKVMLRHAGLAAGAALGGCALASLLYIPLLIPFVSSLAATAGTGFFGYQAYNKIKILKDSPVVSRYVKEQEKTWLEKKTRAPLLSRMGAFCKRVFGKALLPVVKAGKWLGIAKATIGTLLGAVGACQLAGMNIISATALGAAGASVGLSAGGALIAATAICFVAVPAGIGFSLLCRKAANRLEKDFVDRQPESRSVPAFKSRLEEKHARSSSPRPAAGFNAAAPAEQTQLSEERRKVAEERAAQRKRDREKGRRF